MGRPITPAALKVLKGTFRKDRDRSGPTPAADEPDCPDHLSPTAKEEWRRVVGLLTELNMLSKLDRATLAIYCQAWADWVGAMRELVNDDLVIVVGNGAQQPNPLIGIAQKAQETMIRAAKELGLTPAARTHLPTAPGNKKRIRSANYEHIEKEFAREEKRVRYR